MPGWEPYAEGMSQLARQSQTCDAKTGGYDGMFGIYCNLPQGHAGLHNDGVVEWNFIDPAHDAGKKIKALERELRDRDAEIERLRLIIRMHWSPEQGERLIARAALTKTEEGEKK